MKISTQIARFKRVFLDTAPVIYYVEKHPLYADKTQILFDALDAGQLNAISSPVTLSECLVVPYRLGKAEVAQAFLQCLVYSENVSFVAIDENIADKAAELRARYNLSLPDALQIAVALAAGCDAFLTNDAALKRVTELEMLFWTRWKPVSGMLIGNADVDPKMLSQELPISRYTNHAPLRCAASLGARS